MKMKTISSFDEYLKYTESYKGQFYFRGQADSKWEITPSISRNGIIPSLDDERITIQDTINKNNEKLSSLFRMPNQLKALFYLQHYGTKLAYVTLLSATYVLYFLLRKETKMELFLSLTKVQQLKPTVWKCSCFPKLLRLVALHPWN